jgi:hypothetical protein
VRLQSALSAGLARLLGTLADRCLLQPREQAPVAVGAAVDWERIRFEIVSELYEAADSAAIRIAVVPAGALVGAWLGFHATADLMALVNAIVGAVAGANLALILLEMSRSGPSMARSRNQHEPGRRTELKGV